MLKDPGMFFQEKHLKIHIIVMINVEFLITLVVLVVVRKLKRVHELLQQEGIFKCKGCKGDLDSIICTGGVYVYQ